MVERLKLGINIDHVATLRQARYATMLEHPKAEPDVLEAARVCEVAGADSITVHLRADRRHIQDADVRALRGSVGAKLNLEMGNTAEILAIALEVVPDFICLVPENREEITTEGGLDAAGQVGELKETIAKLQGAGVAVSLFIDPEEAQVAASAVLGAEMVELHTGAFANAVVDAAAEKAELDRLVAAARQAQGAGLQVNAGHGIDTANLEKLFAVPHLAELNIGHHLVARGVFIGLDKSVREMREAMDAYEG